MMGPLSLVIMVSMLKDAYEDFKRHKADQKENNTLSDVYNHNTN